MYALISREKTQLPPGTVVRMPGTGQDYCNLRDSRGDGSIPRIKYQFYKRGTLHIYGLETGRYVRQSTNRYFPNINLHDLIAQVFQVTAEQGTGIAMRALRQGLIQDFLQDL